MSGRNLELNSLSRYDKQSPQFILEAQGHCEVPAGCGGVILRWWNPASGFPIEMWMYAAGEFECYLDGKPLVYGRPMVSLGQHVVALRIEVQDWDHGILMFAGSYDEEARRTLSRKTGRKVTIRSAAGEGWKYSLADQKDDTWKSVGFDDSRWRDMIENAVPQPKSHNFQHYRLTGLNVPGLGVQKESLLERLFSRQRSSSNTVFVRKAFSI